MARPEIVLSGITIPLSHCCIMLVFVCTSETFTSYEVVFSSIRRHHKYEPFSRFRRPCPNLRAPLRMNQHLPERTKILGKQSFSPFGFNNAIIRYTCSWNPTLFQSGECPKRCLRTSSRYGRGSGVTKIGRWKDLVWKYFVSIFKS